MIKIFYDAPTFELPSYHRKTRRFQLFQSLDYRFNNYLLPALSSTNVLTLYTNFLKLLNTKYGYLPHLYVYMLSGAVVLAGSHEEITPGESTRRE